MQNNLRAKLKPKILLPLFLIGASAGAASAAVPALTGVDVGIPSYPGATTTAADGKITVVGGGADIWGTADNFHYGYFKATGDFDYVMKVESLTGNSGDGGWSKIELMARREDPASPGVGPQAGDPHISNMTTRPTSDTANSAPAGVNYRGPQWRANRGGNSSWTAPNPAYPPNMPDNWLRLERVGSVFYMYTSNDGTTWNMYNPYSPQGWDTAGSWPAGTDSASESVFTEAWPQTIFLGIAVTAHNDADVTTAVVSHFGPYVGTPPAITKQPAATVKVNANTKLELSVEATGDPLHFQWLKDGKAVTTNGLAATYTVAEATGKDSGTYTVRVYGGGKEVISSPSVVTVAGDTTPPAVTAVSAGDEILTSAVVTFSEAVTDSAVTKGNYAFDGGLTISSVTRLSDRKVKLVTNKQTQGTTYTLTINNIQDYGSPVNTIAADTKVTFKSLLYMAGTVLQKNWDAINTTTIATLTADPRFPDNMTSFSTEPAFEYPAGGLNEAGGNYGNQLITWFTAPASGTYVFFVNGDDYSDLYLSTDENSANKKLIAQETGWSNPRQWQTVGSGDATAKRSDQFATTAWPDGNAITLTAGKQYYLEALHVEGGGGDNIGATFMKDGDAEPADGDASKLTGSLIGAYLDPNGASATFTRQPADTTIQENRAATLTAAATGVSAYGSVLTYRWQKANPGSSDFADIAGATSASYTTPVLQTADSGAKFQVIASVPTLSSTSSVATVTVIKDTVPPKMTKVKASSVQNMIVTFDEPLDKASAETAANYAISDGVTVSKATLSGNAVLLVTSGLTVQKSYVLTVGGVKDLFNNALASGTTFSFVANVITYADVILEDKPIAFYRFEETSGQITKNYGTAGVSADGLYMMGTGPNDSSPTDISSGEGPRPAEFLGFDPNNRSVLMDGQNTMLWIDTQNQLLNNLPAFSLEYWVKPANRVSDPDAFGTRIGLVGQNDAVEYGFINQTTVQIWSSGGGSLDTPYTFPDGEWHHVATIADGRSIKNYYDGVLVGTGGSTTANYGSSTYNVHIGGGGVYDETGNFFTGQFDEVAIFDKAIPAERVAAHFKAGKEGGEAPEPVGEVAFTQVSLAAGQVTIAWEGTGTLEEAAAITGPWTTAASQTNPQTIPATGAGKFYRVRQ